MGIIKTKLKTKIYLKKKEFDIHKNECSVYF